MTVRVRSLRAVAASQATAALGVFPHIGRIFSLICDKAFCGLCLRRFALAFKPPRWCMKTIGLMFACLLCMVLAAPVSADPAKDADLAARVAQLEKRVAELEAALKKAVPDLPKTETEAKMVGRWSVTDADAKLAIFQDLALKPDGSCEVVIRSVGARSNATWNVVGKQLVVNATIAVGTTEAWEQCRVASVDDKELVLEHKVGEVFQKVKYSRDK